MSAVASLRWPVLRRACALSLGALIVASLAAPPAAAQGSGESWRDRLARLARERAEQRAREKVAKDGAGAASGAAASTVAPTGTGASVGGQTVAGPLNAPAAPPGFVAGSRVIFAEDFSRDALGDFPRSLELVSGNMEVAEFRGKRYLRASGPSTFVIPLPETLPDSFTLEFDYMGSGGHSASVYFVDERAYHGGGKSIARWVTHMGGIVSYQGQSSRSEPAVDLRRTLFPVRILARGTSVKMWMGDSRVANATDADLGRTRRITIEVPEANDAPASLIGNIRVAAIEAAAPAPDPRPQPTPAPTPAPATGGEGERSAPTYEAIAAGFADARWMESSRDGFTPREAERSLFALARTPNGGFVLQPGYFVAVVESFAIRIGAHAPLGVSEGGRVGFAYAPLRGPAEDAVGTVLRNVVHHPTLSRADVQRLLWSIAAGARAGDLTAELRQTASRLMPPHQLAALDDARVHPPASGRGVTSVAPTLSAPAAALLQLLATGSADYAAMARIAVPAGAPRATQGVSAIPDGRWSRHPDAYLVRYVPHGIGATRVELWVPPDSPAVAKEFDPATHVAVPADPAWQALVLTARPATAVERAR